VVGIISSRIICSTAAGEELLWEMKKSDEESLV
jgi:hypothetical protein